MLSIRIGKSVFFYFLRDLPHLYRQIGLSACALVGPSLFLYFQKESFPQINIRRNSYLQFTFWSLILLVAGIFYPYARHIRLWDQYFIAGIYFTWMAYVLAAGRMLYIIFWKDTSSSRSFKKNWLLIIYTANALICLTYVLAYFYHKSFYIIGPLTFSFMFYGLSLFVFWHPRRQEIFASGPQKYAGNKIPEAEARRLINKLQSLMQEKKPFKNPDIKLPDLATQLAMRPHQLSQLLNDHLGQRFPQFINSYRIREAEQLLELQPQYSLDAIAFEVGFNSRSTFFASFKKIKGTTPAQFRKQLTSKV